MAHVEKYTKGSVQGLSIHWDRKTEKQKIIRIKRLIMSGQI
ncbi:UNVERIFIED_CONTAM: hypothetical protein ORM23_29850 [Bacillus cereus]